MGECLSVCVSVRCEYVCVCACMCLSVRFECVCLSVCVCLGEPPRIEFRLNVATRAPYPKIPSRHVAPLLPGNEPKPQEREVEICQATLPP